MTRAAASAGEGGERATALGEVRVVELGGGVACAFAGKWLAALGAEVIRVEVAGAEPALAERSRLALGAHAVGPRRAYLGIGKRSVHVDPASERDRAGLTRLVAGSDLVLDGSQWPRCDFGLDEAAFGGTARVRVTPFGATGGPYAAIPATALTLGAFSGLMWHAGDTGGAPIALFGDQPELLAGLHALAAALAALVGGRGVDLDVAAIEVAAAVVGHHTGRYSQVQKRVPRQRARVSWRIYRTADGHAGLSCNPRDRARCSEAMGVPEVATLAAFMQLTPRDEQVVLPVLEKWFAERSGAEIEALANREGVPLAAVRTLGGVAASPQLAAREFFVRVPQEGGRSALVPGQLWRSDAHGFSHVPASAPGADTRALLDAALRHSAGSAPSRVGSEPRLPLAGVRVLDLGQVWAGPYAAMLLADQGADVIKIESPKRWDSNRCAVPPAHGREREWWNTGAYYAEYSRNKRALGLDFATARGREVLARLVKRADIVIENYRAGVLDKLGVGYEWLRRQRGDIVLVSMAAFGQTGPERERPGYGPVMEQLSGLAHLTGFGDGVPRMAIGFAYGDPVAATAAAAAACAALVQRRRSGRGQHIDLAQFEILIAMLGEAFAEWSLTGREPAQMGNGREGCAPHGCYPCAGDDEWVAIAVESDEQWLGLRRVLGDPEWARDPGLASAAARWERRDELDARVADWTRGLAKREVFERCAEHGVPAAPVSRSDELLDDPQLLARAYYERVEHPFGGAWQMHGWEWRPRGAGRCIQRLAPDFGGHNAEILRELAGLSDTEIAELAAQGVVGAVPIGVPELPA